MNRYALAIVLMLLHGVFFSSISSAKDSAGTSAQARKQQAKKSTARNNAQTKAGRKPRAPSVKKSVSKKTQAKAVAKARPRSAAKARSKSAVRKKTVAVRSKRVPAQRVTAAALRTAPAAAGLSRLDESAAHDDPLDLRSSAALIWDAANADVLFEKNSDAVLPIASITKLMTALVVVEAGQDMDEVLEVTSDDIDRIKHTSSRLRIGSRLTRANMLHIALMSSENRAASALGRHYPGGLARFVAAMNARAKALGMHDTHYVEPTGLSSHNVSSPRDLAKLVMAAQQHPVIREYSTNREYAVDPGGRTLQYRNSNRLIANANPGWDIVLQKTGYISEAGRCLVMQTRINGRSIVMVFLDSKGKFSRAADAGRVRKWLEGIANPKM